SSDKELKLKLYGYRDSARSQNVEDDDGEQSSRDMERLAADIVGHCRGAANLIFANAKSQVEELADACARLGRAEGLADRFLVHHGSLSAEIREEAEATMKSGAAATTFCSSTLEMGVDIGSVKMVGQVGTPWSVASLKQRLGRGGRREGEPRILRMYVECQEPDAKSDLFDRLHLELVQAVAITELMLGHWVEPPAPPACDLSTLTQQIISAICQSGGARADRLYQSLCSGGAFHDVNKQLFARLLRQLADQDVVEQTPEGDLILGLVGERLRKDKGFYAVFPTPDEYAVLFDGQRLGTLACAPKKDEFLLFAGRRWKVVAVDPDRLEMHVQRSHGRRKPKFLGGGGEVHSEVRRKMREVLSTAAAYRYLDASAAALLEEARRAAKSSGVCCGTIVPLGPMQTALMTWTGTRAVLTLQAMLAVAKIETENQGIALVIHQPSDRVAQLVRKCSDAVHDPLTVVRHITDAPERKYNWLLGRDLLWEQAARGWIDVRGALRALSGFHDGARA
ncbi:MAG: putative ATP-dependent helicase Lhr, partial [Gammaproteobacteria bacterium]|nr:putative ATP-dependent helicase Lhr [Gammaproteobacteria bacterium]